MDTGSVDFFQILLIGLGAASVARGIIILVTGRLSARDEARIGEFSENGVKKYKLLLAIVNIVCGAIVIAMSIIEMLNVFNKGILSIVILAILVLMIILFVVVRNHCKKVP